jgi:regulator of sigma D
MDMGEMDLGDPQTLKDFITICLKFPAERYLFFTFAHGQGVIETEALSPPTRHKSIAISPDHSSGRLMTLTEFRDSVRAAMGSRKFDLMVFFSCLANMVEVGYALRDLTDFAVGSEDVIRVVNDPPGTFQIRGIMFEEVLRELASKPDIAAVDLGRRAVDAYIRQYEKDALIPDDDGNLMSKRFSGGLSLVRCASYNQLAKKLDALALTLSLKMRSTEEESVNRVLTSLNCAMKTSQRYRSFLDLEYYDLVDFLQQLHEQTTDNELQSMCREVLDFVSNHVVVYEKHTTDSRSNGVSIYLSNYLVPENVFRAHQIMYSASSFGRETAWDDMIGLFRAKMDAFYPDILSDRCQQAIRGVMREQKGGHAHSACPPQH